MSSPFSWFRKRQRLLLGFFGVLLIFVFTISMGSGVDPLVDLLSGNWQLGPDKGPVVVSWRDGQLYERDLQELRVQRRLAAEYVRNLWLMTLQQGGQPREVPLDISLENDALLRLQLLADQAKEMGLTISDDDIKDYLIGLTDGRLEEWQLSEIWRNTTGGQFSDRRLFDLLRRELAAHRVGEMLRGTIASPLQYWDMFDRMERRVSVEMMPIEVDDFLDEVPEPSEEELQAFFDLYRSQFATPGNPTPGFRQRERRAFEFVRFDRDALVKQEMAKITDDEVRKYYEANKEEFIQTSLPASDLDPAPLDSKAGTPDEAPPTQPTDEPAEPADTPPEKNASQDEAGTEPPTPTETPVSQDEAAAPAATEVPATTSDAENDGADQTSAVTEPSSAATDKTAVTDETAPPASAGKSEPSAERYRPLDEVADEIRQRLALPRAQTRLDDLVGKAQHQIEKYLQWHRTHPDSSQAPPAITWEEISPDLPLSIETIPFQNELEIQAEELGKQVETVERGGDPYWVYFSEIGFDPALQPYTARIIPMGSYVGPKFLFWLTAVEPAYEPSLEEIRDEVVVAWKRRRALELARAEADAALSKAKAAGKPLHEVLAESGRTFLGPLDVRWMSLGNFPTNPNAQAQPVAIPGVDGTTVEMLRTIFRMEPGDLTTLTNAPETIVYVVRAIESDPSVDVRRQFFLRGGGAELAINKMVASELGNLSRNTYFDLLHKEQVQWLREPESPAQ